MLLRCQQTQSALLIDVLKGGFNFCVKHRIRNEQAIINCAKITRNIDLLAEKHFMTCNIDRSCQRNITIRLFSMTHHSRFLHNIYVVT